jgi:hypothetical protein
MRAVSVLAGGEIKRNNGAGDDSSIFLCRSELATGEPARPRLEVYIKAQTTKYVNSRDCNDQLTANVLYHAIKLIKHLWERSAAADKVRVERLGLQQENQHVREYVIVIRRRRWKDITISRIISKRARVSGGQLGPLDG